ncbi:MAG: Fe-S-containing protein [Spirochaetaceae bacterium]|jgi:uncharacterized membrane protein|nr:Fe-S-containing protein [Spirochaetaceae bacterium]
MIRYCILAIQSSLITAVLLAMVQAAVFSGKAPHFTAQKTAHFAMQKKLFAICCAAGTFAAAVLTVLRRTTAINRGMVNTWILCAAIVFGIVFAVLLWRDNGASRLTRELCCLSSSVLAGALLFYALPFLFLLPADFVMAGQSVFSTEFLVNLTGALTGTAIAFLAGLMVFYAGKQMAEVSPLPFKIILSAALAVNMANQAANALQFLMARRIIPLNRTLFKIIMPALNHQNFFTFAVTIIAAMPPLLLLTGIFSREHRTPALVQCKTAGSAIPPNPAVIRKQKAAGRRNRRRNTAALLLLAFPVFALTGLKALSERAVVLSPAEPFTLTGEEIIIPVTQIEDGHLHRFAWNASDNTEVRFIVVKKSASAWGVGLDACDICGNTGYYERRDGIICRLCDVVMNKSTIGFKGGCNPVPLAYTVREGAMIVRLSDLEAEKGRFK